MAGRLAAAFPRGEDYSALRRFCFLSELEGSGCSPEALANGSEGALSEGVCTLTKRGRVAFA